MKIRRNYSIFALVFALTAAFSACSFIDYAESGTLIIGADKASEKIAEGYILIDARKTDSYKKKHIQGAVNIERAEIMISEPVANMLATSSKVSRAAGNAGLKETSDLIIYDDNKSMDAARLYWTLKIWGHKGNILLTSGGMKALEREGMPLTDKLPAIASQSYKTSPLDASMITSKEEIIKKIENPAENYVLIDVRSDEEYNAGNIPGSIHINYEKNMFLNQEKGDTFRPVSHIRILYKELGITPDDEIVLYCKTSVRAANTYAALYNAGYRNLKIYDGAWLEWSTEDMRVVKPDVQIKTTTASGDNS